MSIAKLRNRLIRRRFRRYGGAAVPSGPREVPPRPPSVYNCRTMRRRWQVYLLRCRDGSLYTGITDDLDARIVRHNAGTGSKYVRSRLPASLAYAEPARSRSAAMKREAEIKSWPRPLKLALLNEK